MLGIILVTLKGIIRDRVLQGILFGSLIFLSIPSLSSFSMRQVTELSMMLSLSLSSFILLLLSIFLGSTSIWRDIERRYSYSVLSLPLSRAHYIAGRFLGIAGFVFCAAIFFGIVTSLIVIYTSGQYPPDRPVQWLNLAMATLFMSLKYIMLVGFAILFSTFSTSFFLPVFGTITIFAAGSFSQEVYDYIHLKHAESFAPLFKKAVTGLYYILPNFSAFDYKTQAIYGLPMDVKTLVLIFLYFLIYVFILLYLSIAVFSKREMK